MKLYVKNYDESQFSKLISGKEEVAVWNFIACTIKQFNEKYSKTDGLWESIGVNHKEINNNSYRQINKVLSYIEVESIEQLVKMICNKNLCIWSEDAPSECETNIYFIGCQD